MRIINIGLSIFIMVVWGIIPPVGRYLVGLNSSITSFQLAFLRYFIGFLTLLVLHLKYADKKFNSIKTYSNGRWRFLFSGILLASFSITLFTALELTSASIGGLLMNANALLIGLFSFILLGVKIKKNEVWGLIIGMVGIIIVLTPSISGTGNILGNILSFISGIIWALYSVILKGWFNDEDPLEVMMINLGIASIITAIFAFSVQFQSINLFQIILILSIGVGSTGLGFSGYLLLMKRETVTVAGSIQLAIPGVSILLSFLFFDEKILLIEWLGTIIIIIAMAIIFFKNN